VRTISDQSGCLWDVTMGRESYGVRVLLFCPRDGGDVRKAALDSLSSLAASAEIDCLSDDGLRQLLARSETWC